MPHDGYIKRLEIDIPGLKFSSNTYTNLLDFERSLENMSFPVFSLFSIDRLNLFYEIGFWEIEFYFSGKILLCKQKLHTKDPSGKIQVPKGTILNIKSEINTANLTEQYKYAVQTNCKSIYISDYFPINDVANEFYTYLATILIELDPLDD